MNSDRDQIPLPRPTELSRPHWEGCQEGVLRVQRCRECGGYVFVPQPVCTHCFERKLDWVESTGRGVLYSFTTIHRPQQPSFDVPYIAIIVELEEGMAYAVQPEGRDGPGCQDRNGTRSFPSNV